MGKESRATRLATTQMAEQAESIARIARRAPEMSDGTPGWRPSIGEDVDGAHVLKLPTSGVDADGRLFWGLPTGQEEQST